VEPAAAENGQRRAVFLDRDGVLNRAFVRNGKPCSPTSPAQFEILPGVAEAVGALRRAGLLAIVVTNQPDLSTGRQTPADVEAMHEALRATVPLDGLEMCACVDADNCARRKPKPGMLIEAAREFSIDLSRSFLVGDRWRDVGAGRAAGCRTLFIDHGYAEALPEKPDYVVADLAAAARVILSEIKAGTQASRAEGGA
jgi:D-glycero-D-manno-heptose 1,7-bisphosphate phosphatase